ALAVPHALVDRFPAAAATGLAWHAPLYGRIEPTPAIRISHRGILPFWIVSVFGLTAENRVLDVETVPVRARAGTLAHGTAVRLDRARSTDYLLIAEPPREDATGVWHAAGFQ